MNELQKKHDKENLRRIFNDVKENYVKENKNFYYRVPYMQIVAYRTSLLLNILHNPEQLLKADLDFEQFYELNKKNLSSGKFEWFVTGNLTPEQAVDLTEKPEKVFKNIENGEFEMLQHVNELVQIQPVNIPKSTTLNYIIQAKDKDNVNSCVLSYFQKGEDTMEAKIMNEVVFQYLNEPTFDQLRTKEQLGYIAASFGIPVRLIEGGGFIVQSAVGSPEYLISRIDSLLDTHREEVKTVSDEYFKQMVNSVIDNKKQKDLSLREETRRLGYEIMSHQYEFDRKEKEIKLLKELTKEEFIEYFYDLFYNEPKRLNIHLLANQHLDSQEEYKKVNEEYTKKYGIKNEYIDSIDAFKAQANYYPDLYKIEEQLQSKM